MRFSTLNPPSKGAEKKRVGIPRAMGYYYLYPFLHQLLLELGAEPVLSAPTTRAIMERIDVCPTDEPCLAVKLFFSHADSLSRREDIDFLLLPRITTMEKQSCCPKFIGIADMVRVGLHLPENRVCIAIIEYSQDNKKMAAGLQPLAQMLGITDVTIMHAAIQSARKAQEKYRRLCVTKQLTTPEAFQSLQNGQQPDTKIANDDRPVIALIGHPYLLYEYVTLGMVDFLRDYGQLITAEMVDEADIAREMATIHEGKRLWPFEAMILGSALHLLRSGQADKMLLVGSFECGPESIIENYIECEAEQQGIPLMMLALDEHSGEAGLMTRLEAFMDTERIADNFTTPPDLPIMPIHQQEMVLGFPSMGHLDIAIRTIIESSGVKTVHTPRSTESCVRLGKEISPEFVCFPFIATLGQMRYMLDNGANTLFMLGGKGFCRLGWYAQLQERLLRNIGYQFDMIIADSPFPLWPNFPQFCQMLRTITGGAKWSRIISSVHFGYKKLLLLDKADQIALNLRAYEREQGTINGIIDKMFHRVDRVSDFAGLRRIETDFTEECAALELEETDPIHIGIAGEIWVILEQITTRGLERRLGANNRPRVRVHREHNSSGWFNTRVLRLPSAVAKEQRIINAAAPWLAHWVGGHGQLTVGEMALAADDKRDGMIHVFPFTCMPEIIAQNIIVGMGDKLGIPVLSYIVSEQTGEAGMETRLESFIDLLEERKYYADVFAD